MSKNSFLYGTLVLVGAGFITKVLGFVYRIALSRIIGAEGMGLFQMAFPILIFFMVVTTVGLPVAISKLVSEAAAKNEEHRIRSILIVSIIIVTFTSILFTSLILFFSPVIANFLLTDERAIYALLSIAPIIPIISISSIFRGYFQGKQHMNPYALSTIIEQLVRIFTVLFLAQYLLPLGIEYAAAGAMIGMVIGEFTGMLYLIYSFKKDPHRPLIRPALKIKKALQGKMIWKTCKDLLRIGLPVTASRLVGSLSYAIEPIVVAQSLAIAGIATTTATALYGQLEGMAIPLVFFPSFITYALSVSLVPAISEAAAQNNSTLVTHRLEQAVRLSLIVGAPCAIMIFVLAEPLSLLLYHQTDVAHLMKIMAPFAIFLYLQGPLASVLQGLDQASVAMKNSIWGAIVKTLLIFILASQPQLGIDGVAIAVNGGMIMVTTLHFISIARIIPLTIYFRDLLKLAIALVAMGGVLHQVMNLDHLSLFLRVILSFTSSLGVYLILLIFLSLIRKNDLVRIPYLGKWITRIFLH
ncbi:stage V sporulation protein B [Thermoflavimicrobium dichotomicum]|uniref:Stage V sporulation protein B n=1 Tax=Thermoflavimicrobium dichotomicum TaxID=46223 RepID=A0A1I3R6H9_9BACL|nr:stage V sporulation protein B [Thermoflavimicrobium dichotomicum]SFJ40957.1 stage V sporulation protein B [Thermoflavimicrobium dichotomicum]